MAESLKPNLSSPTANARDGESSSSEKNMPPATHFSRSLRHVLWMSSGSVLTRILNLFRGIIMARLLTPFDFGVYGLGGTIVGVKERLADFGAGSFLIYRPKDIEAHAETTFWVNTALSTVLLTVLAIAAPFLAKLYREPLLTPVLILLGLGVWARLNASVHQSLLRTEGRFRALALIDNGSSITWLATAAALAWLGFGVWALVVSAVTANVVLAVLLIATQGWRPRWRISKSSLYVLGGFSLWYLGQGLVWYLAGNVDQLLIGRYLGMVLLGIYVLAYNYATLAVTLIGNNMGSVAFAELPKLYGHAEEFWSSYRNFSRAQALAACLVAFAGAVVAPELIPLIFGAKWSAAIVPFQILSISGALRCIWLDPFLAFGNFRSSCLAGLFWAPATGLAVVFGLRYGLAGVCCAVVVLQATYEVGALLLMTRSWRKLMEVSGATTPYLAGGIFAAVLGLWTRHFVRTGTPASAIAAAAVALIIFMGVYSLLFKTAMKELVQGVLGRLAKGESA